MKKQTSQKYAAIVWRQFKKSKLALACLYFIALLVFMAVFAPLLANDRPIIMKHDGKWSMPALFHSSEHIGVDFVQLRQAPPKGTWMLMPPIPYRPGSYDLDAVLARPSEKHILGTDGDGRDVAAQLIWGARASLSVGIVAVGIAVAIGIVMGLLAGFYGGVVDIVVSRLIEVMICFPTFFLVLAVLAFVGPSIYNIMIVIGVTGWTGVARLVRGECLKLRRREFVVAATVSGSRETSRARSR